MKSTKTSSNISFKLVITNVTAASEAYNLYGIG